MGRVRATGDSWTVGGLRGGVKVCFACELPRNRGWETHSRGLHSFFRFSAMAAVLAVTLAGEKEEQSAAVWFAEQQGQTWLKRHLTSNEQAPTAWSVRERHS
jgi:hypothetical protein